MNDKDDRLFKQWADGYVEQYGQALKREQKMLEEQKVAFAMPRADERVRQLSNSNKKKRKLTPYFAIAAAVLVAFIGVAGVAIPFYNQLTGSVPSQSSIGSSDAVDPSSPSDNNAIHELGFNLPAQFSVAGVNTDNGETIYQLDNSLYDDAVLTIRDSENNNGLKQDMDEIIINGTPVPAKLRDEYKLIAFESKSRKYTLSCKNDIKTLVIIYHSITEAENNL